MSALGVIPCLLLELRKVPGSGFWQAAWVTSTLFGFMHTGNSGETWIGIFSAAAIGFVFCVSIRLTGSAWWAIGFHGAWDWAQTFFYGTADSGFQPQGHYLSTSPAGPAFWSGGADGPEGSILVVAIILLTILGLVVVYGRKSKGESPSPAAHAQLS
jgi:membrane protease YdiL (CAAX protease family)